jgi:preprotein translocase subunit SecG
MTALVTVLESGSTTGWTIGYIITIVVVLVVVALVVPILLLAHKIGGQAAAIDESLQQSVTNTAGLAQLHTTIDLATRIIAGLTRGRKRLGG